MGDRNSPERGACQPLGRDNVKESTNLAGLRAARCAVWIRGRWHSRAHQMARSGLLRASDRIDQRVERGNSFAVVALVQIGRVEEYRLQSRASRAHHVHVIEV